MPIAYTEARRVFKETVKMKKKDEGSEYDMIGNKVGRKCYKNVGVRWNIVVVADDTLLSGSLVDVVAEFP